MSVFKRITLAAMTILVVALIVRDPHQAHRPPELRHTAALAATHVAV
jgi:hypothetical protein